MQNKRYIKWVSWPTLEGELKLCEKFLRGNILNAGSGYRQVRLTNAKKITNFDIQKFPGVDVVGSVEEMPFRDKEYDGVLSIAVLEHCERPWKAVEEMSRVTKKGGRIICVVPFMQPIHLVPCDYYRFTPDGIKYLLKQNGFRVVRSYYTHTVFHTGGWYMEDVLKNKNIIFQTLFYPLAKINYLLTKYCKFNVITAPNVITICATKVK